MIVRNLQDKEVLETTYIAHGGAIAQMILDQRTLEAHVDPMEEIYFISSGEGEMTVGDETRHVKSGDAVWIPTGSVHALTNSGDEDCYVLVVASPVW
jgi:mannose-6-phosphate isomerase-like protein (cupin superfamily)